MFEFLDLAIFLKKSQLGNDMWDPTGYLDLNKVTIKMGG